MLGKPVDTIVITTDTFCRVPSDRCFGIFFAFVLHGLGCFLPWNLLFHSYEYFVCCKFLDDDSDIYRQYFLSFCALAALLAALVSTGIGLFIGFHGDTKRRIIPSIVVLIIMFILQVLFAIFDARDSSGVFLCITILNIVIIGAFIGLYLSSVSGIVSYFPDRYVNALVIGTSLGILIAICSRIAFKYYSNDPRVIAIYFLVSAIVTLLFCFDIYFAFPYSQLFRFYHTSIKIDLLNTTKGRSLHVPYGKALKQIWLQCLSIWLHYFSTVTLFPSILSQVQSVTPNFLNLNLEFADGVVLINFALFNLLGNFLAGCIKKPYSRWISVFVFLRAILALIVCLFVNFEPYSRHNLPVLIHNDYIFMTLVIVFGFTHGYFNSLLQMLTTKSVEPYLSTTSAVILQLFIFAGCFFGIIGSFLYHFIATLS
ncbi:unnamed protein product [Rotaria magnacalcarata]|uniref:Equilibrative nucleoside transporter 1 n=1 Tax=Rotaria magnacalcarata TaxID=392030 RepID=A0A816W8F4_9BILA|nr:unnamed protein product [Rotaria magnacalcarata]CAF1398002.1 unnamed protein product [Rotaria magnacalcarata]CAF2052639.1 unnamed protein product [Rotaria magnacalcarata]CAF2129903.1 unnamed protein product [Rotaria magnacalcarata]CAF2130045.1 unnamed protein product [Rotaria magnacalcarata]